jgi:hypothetical protein
MTVLALQSGRSESKPWIDHMALAESDQAVASTATGYVKAMMTLPEFKYFM